MDGHSPLPYLSFKERWMNVPVYIDSFKNSANIGVLSEKQVTTCKKNETSLPEVWPNKGVGC